MANDLNRMKLRKMAMAFDCHYREIGRLGDPCIYCGVASDTYDHIPPLSFVSRLPIDDLASEDLRKVPACSECNGILGGILLDSIPKRRAFVNVKLRKKYRSFLRMPRWSGSELDELGDNLRDDVSRSSRYSAWVKRRV